MPDKRTAPMVRRAYELAVSSGVPAAVQYLRAHAPEKTWSMFTVRRLLASPAYRGAAVHGDPREDSHEPIADGVTWRRVQTLRGIPESWRRQQTQA